MQELSVPTNTRSEFIDITDQVQAAVRAEGITEGLCHVFVPHTTAGVTINENADPDVTADLLKELNKIVPFNDAYAHTEGNSAAHIKSSLVGCSEMLIIENGRPVFGTWQGVYFCEFDGHRNRRIVIQSCNSF